jgi:signal transduction histidine kinase
MSIRLRLTFLYSVILTLILIVFSLVLYLGQAQATFREFRRRLADRARPIAEAGQPLSSIGDVRQPSPPIGVAGQPQPPLMGAEQPRPSIGNAQPSAPPVPPALYSPAPGEIYYIQVRNLDGDIVEYGDNVDETMVLPLSEAGLQAVRRGQPWDEIVELEGERFLVHSQSVREPGQTDQIVQVAVSLTRRDEDLATLRNILITGSCITVLIAFGVGWLMAGLALRPVNRITHTAQAIGAERNFSRRIDHPGPNDEIGQLATTFNNMLNRLQAAYQQVEQSLQAQRRFVADASHELRTPLTTIRGNIDLLQREPPINDEDRVDVLTDTVNETERLMRLVNNLLTLARADAKRPLRSERVSAKPLLEEVSQQMKSLAPTRTIVCQPNLETDIIGDRDALKQVLLILGDNALKHTPAETAIAIVGNVIGEHITISVRDNGPGIKPEKLPYIFDRFYRSDDSRVGPGTGLGLAIAKELTEAQNGTITVRSEVGKGTAFTLTFPKPPSL